MGRRIGQYNEKHLSPWQRMINDARVEQEISFRKLGAESGIPASTLCNWMNTDMGHPEKGSYGIQVNKRLSRALKLNPIDLMKAYDESALMFTAPRAPGTRNPLAPLRAVVESSDRQRWTKGQILKLIEEIDAQ